MKKFFVLSALALAAFAVNASASTILVSCGSFSASYGGGYNSTIGSTIASGTLNCPGFTIPGGSTLGTPTELIYQSDFTSGAQSTNTTTTVFGSPIVDSQNVATGFIGSSSYTAAASGSSECPCSTPGIGGGTSFNGSYFEVALGSSNLASGFGVTYSDTLTAGSIQGGSGNLFELVSYSQQVTSPEPTTFVLMGAGLGLLGMLRRRATRS